MLKVHSCVLNERTYDPKLAFIILAIRLVSQALSCNTILHISYNFRFRRIFNVVLMIFRVLWSFIIYSSLFKKHLSISSVATNLMNTVMTEKKNNNTHRYIPMLLFFDIACGCFV